jgi:hypothetical protein
MKMKINSMKMHRLVMKMFAGALDCYEQKERKKENPVA